MTVEYASDIKRFVPMRVLCDRYGITVNRDHKAICPFHPDRSPSMEVYDGSRGWWCFVCNQGGDVIDFTRRYFNLTFRGAMERLNEDFSLHLPLDRPPDAAYMREVARRREEQAAARRFEAWRLDTVNQLADCSRLANLALKFCQPSAWTDGMVAAIREHATVDYYLDVLDGRDADAIMQIFRHRKEVRELCFRILPSTPERSTVA